MSESLTAEYTPEGRVIVTHDELVTALVVALRVYVPERTLKALVRPDTKGRRVDDPQGKVDAAKRELVQTICDRVFRDGKWQVTRVPTRGLSGPSGH